jgi:hypothetical protein
MRLSNRRLWTLLALIPILGIGGSPVHGQTEAEVSAEMPVGEVLTYGWELKGALSFLAGLFLPDSGTGILTTELPSGDVARSQLRIVSQQSASDEFWLYGAEIDPASGNTKEVWSAYKWRGKESSKRQTLTDERVIDVVSGIYGLRRDPPDDPRRLEIWSDGKTYPVIIIPETERQIGVCGQRMKVQPYSIRGLDLPDRRHWKGRLEIWLAHDAQATPVRIVVDRGWARVRLDLRAAREDGQGRGGVCGDRDADLDSP